jgi:chaperonin cofactor prefoldin
MKKKFDDLKDIENFFLEEEKKTSTKTPLKSPNTVLENKIKNLESEIKDLKRQISVLESGIDKKTSNKGGNLSNRDTEDIAKMFMDFSVDNLKDKEVKKEIETLRDENQSLKKENKKLINNIKTVEIKVKDNSNKKLPYDKIREDIYRKYSFLTDSSKIALLNAEYTFLNENSGGYDYSGAYVSYVKALEIELRRVFNFKKEKLTFGNLLEKLKKHPEFKTFVDIIEKEKVGEIRNFAVHTRPIAKFECGKIRKLLVEEKWLDRITFLVEESFKEKLNSDIDFDLYIFKKDGYQYYNNKSYNKYSTDGPMDLLALKGDLGHFVKGKGKIVKIGANYFIVL